MKVPSYSPWSISQIIQIIFGYKRSNNQIKSITFKSHYLWKRKDCGPHQMVEFATMGGQLHGHYLLQYLIYMAWMQIALGHYTNQYLFV
jgi:hypothetical protein